ncbi:hypothetical protein ACT8ZV_12740 [Nocardioides sp. MAHUQ-72]|uniref:hypothetical protein n=1 Tax=unclassified Nocardioides TaxID=2615069 RepID=UPI00360DE3F8
MALGTPRHGAVDWAAVLVLATVGPTPAGSAEAATGAAPPTDVAVRTWDPVEQEPQVARWPG